MPLTSSKELNEIFTQFFDNKNLGLEQEFQELSQKSEALQFDLKVWRMKNESLLRENEQLK